MLHVHGDVSVLLTTPILRCCMHVHGISVLHTSQTTIFGRRTRCILELITPDVNAHIFLVLQALVVPASLVMGRPIT